MQRDSSEDSIYLGNTDIVGPHPSGADENTYYNEGKHLFDKLGVYGAFKYYQLCFKKVSEIQILLMHTGVDVYLIGGKLLNTYRDGGIIPLNRFDYGVGFAVWEDEGWHPGGDKVEQVWNCVVEFIERDDEIEFSHNPEPCYVTFTDQHEKGHHGVMTFNFKFKSFPEYPDRNIEIARYAKNETENGSIIQGFKTVGWRQRALSPEWLCKKSVVYMYGSPFWTIDEKYIETYLLQRYGEDWYKSPTHLSGISWNVWWE